MLNMVWKSTERFGNLSLEKYGIEMENVGTLRAGVILSSKFKKFMMYSIWSV